MRLLFEEFYDFIPAWNGNATATDPVIFHCRYLSASEWGRYIQKEVVADGERAKVILTYKDREIFEASVISIENLEVNGKPIKTAKDFLGVPLSDLYQEVVNGLIARGSKPDLKN